VKRAGREIASERHSLIGPRDVVTLRLAIVEDDSSSAVLIKRLLEQSFAHGVEVEIADSVRAASRLSLAEYDAILLDLSLPDAQGHDTFDRIHRQAPLTPVILVTGTDDEALAEALIRAGAQDYLVKGRFNARELRRAVRYAIERQTLRVELARVRDDLAVVEQALAKRHTSASHASFTWVHIHDEFYLRYFNEAAASLRLNGSHPVLGLKASSYFPRDSPILPAMRRVFESGDAVRLRVTLPQPESQREVVITCAFVPPNTVTLFVEQDHDEGAALASREAAEMRLRTIFEKNPVPAFLWRIEGSDYECLEANRAALRVSNAARDLVGRRARQLFADRPQIVDVMQRVSRTGRAESIAGEAQLFGPERRATITIAEIYPDRLLTYVQELANAPPFELLEGGRGRLVEAAPVGVTILDREGRIQYANPTIAAMLGYTPEELLRMKAAELLFPSDLLRDPPRLELPDESGSFHRERVLRAKDGRAVIVETSVAALDEQRLFCSARDVTAIRRAQEETAFQAHLLAHVKDAVIATDMSGRVVYWNHRAEELYGWPQDEALGRLVTQLNTPAELWDAARGAMATALRDGRWEGDVVGVRKDGSRIPIFVALSATYDAAGRQSGVVSISYDRSALKEAEEARARNELLLTTVIDRLPVGVWIADAGGHVVLSNRRAREIWRGVQEFTPADFENARGWWPESGRRLRADEWPAAIALQHRQAVVDQEIEVEDADGERVWVNASAVPIIMPSGDFLGAVIVHHDITEKRRAQAALRSNESLFRSLIEHSSDIITILSDRGTILYESPSVESILGFSAEDLRGRSFFDFIRPAEADAVRAHLTAQLQSDASARIDVEIRRADGSWLAFDVITSRYFAGGEVRIIANARDVTERNALARGLEQADRMAGLGRLAATIAHEINNTLMGIQTFTDLLQRRTVNDPEQIRLVNQIRRSVDRGKHITSEILRFARPSEPQMEKLRLRDFLETLTAELRSLVSIPFHVALPPADVWVRADKHQMSQVLTNLVLNARDATANRGEIRIETTLAGDDVCLIVADTGEGMSREVRARIFDPLFSTKRSGTGLGLSVVYQIVMKHNGSIDVWSEKGEGSAFTITLPRVTDGVDEEAEPEATVQRPAVRRILLVEDDPHVIAGITLLLESEGFSVASTSNGLDAEAAIERFRPDVVLIDYGLPDINGLEVYQRLERRWPQLAVIFTTGSQTEAIEELATRPNVAVLYKPFDVQTLLHELQKVT